MIRYMIHTCMQREWYVREFLLPSMYAQGIDSSKIYVFGDNLNIGALENCMRSFEWIDRTQSKNNHIWHLQDDVILCSDFAKRTKILDETEDCILCGFSSRYDNHEKDKEEYVTPMYMWYSFPCIRIPNNIAGECARWFYSTVKSNSDFDYILSTQKHDDLLFRSYFLQSKYPNIKVKNLIPNLVDHIDYLIGGSLINADRENKEVRSSYWEEENLVIELKKAVANHLI